MNEGGTVTISIDFELAWGMADRIETAYDIISHRRRAETAYLGRLLDICDRLEIPLTFATVGHLFLDSCDGVHAKLPRTDGLRVDPGTDSECDPLFYAPDLIESIRRAEVPHEIGTHTFSHVICDSVPSSVVDQELKAVADIHERNGLKPPRSLVAPRNRLPDYDVLRENGIEIVRVPQPLPADTEVGKYGARLRTWITNPSPVIGRSTVIDGVSETYATPYPSLTAVHLPNGRANPLVPFRIVPRTVRQRAHESYLRRALETAIERETNLHLWTHLYNLSNPSQWEPIRSFLHALADYRNEGQVHVERMVDRIDAI